MFANVSFRKLISFVIFIIYLIFSVALFSIFNNFYLRDSRQKFIDENKYSAKVAQDFIKKESDTLVSLAQQISNDSILRYAFRKEQFIDIDYKSDENPVNIVPMNMLSYRKLAINLKNVMFGWNEGWIVRDIELYNSDLVMVSNSSNYGKKEYDIEHLKIALGKEGGQGGEYGVIEETSDGFVLKGFSPIHRNKHFGVVVVKEKLDNILIEEIKKITSKEVFIAKKNKIIISTVFKNNERIENVPVNFGGQDIKTVELSFDGRMMIYEVFPILNDRKNVVAYIGVGFYDDEITKFYRTATMRFFVYEVIFSVILFIIVYLFIFFLFRPFKTIINAIKIIGDGNYDDKVYVKTGKELTIVAESINNLANKIKRREEELKQKSEEARDNAVKYEQEKQKKLEAIVKLSGAIVHELKTPLVGIRGFANIAKRKYPNEEKIQQYMDLITKESQRVDDMATQLLEYAGQGDYSYVYELVPLKSLIEEILLEKEKDIQDNRIEIIEEIDEKVFIKVDYTRMKGAFSNIIKNSIEAIRGIDDFIAFKVKSDEEFITLFIKDNGSGIHKDIKDRIMEPLFSTKTQGTGLGLPISENIIRSHGGSLEIESDGEKGTEVKINLPKK